MAVLTAALAVFSIAVGAPKVAMMQSPSYLSTCPPKRSTAFSRTAKQRFMTSTTSSGSIFSDMAVKPDTSANRTVACRRSLSIDCR